MPRDTQRNGTAGEGDSLILTPSKLRLHSQVFGPYVTCTWLPNAVFAGLLLFKISMPGALPWWAVFLPQFLGHLGHALLLFAVALQANVLVQQQLGPAPPPRASPGMVLQYSRMFSERQSALLLDSACGLLETVAGLIVKILVCRVLADSMLASVCWRLLLLPCWVAWAASFGLSLFKPRRERSVGSLRDLQYVCLLFVALKLDGLAPYTWSVVFLIPWMWFGTLLLGAVVTACVIVVAYTCMDLRDLALPGGFLALLLAAAVQMPGFISLSYWLDGDPDVTAAQILAPQVASWGAMWFAGLVICYGLHKKEVLRARLAAAGQVWTAHEAAARELMSLEVEDMQSQVDKMSNEELAALAMRMMAGKVQPQQLLRVGSTLYRTIGASATSSSLAVTLKHIDVDGTALLGQLACSTAVAAAAADVMEQGGAHDAKAAFELAAPAPGQQQQQCVTSYDGAVCVSVQLLPRGGGAAAQQLQLQPLTVLPGSSSSDALNDADACVAISDGAPVVALLPPPPGCCAGGGGGGGHGASAAALPPPPSAAAAAADTDDDGLCTICYDRPATCVFIRCGHGGYCWRCAHVLYARPPSECPVCRQAIDQVVELEEPHAKVGQPARVKAQPRPPSSGSGGGSGGGGGGRPAPRPSGAWSLGLVG